MFLFSRAFLLSFSLKLLYQEYEGEGMAIQFHQEMKDRDHPTKKPVRNPQQSNEQANPMGQSEKENPFPDPIGLTPRQRSTLLRRHALHQ